MTTEISSADQKAMETVMYTTLTLSDQLIGNSIRAMEEANQEYLEAVDEGNG